ncbi:hypothetical protein ACFL5F_00670 [Planctomycetota bacterium]
MKKTIFIMAILCVGMVGLTQAAEYTLFAGQDMPVGIVEVTEVVIPADPPDIPVPVAALKVEYILEDFCLGVELQEVHLHLGTDPELDDFPLNKYGNNRSGPKIGHFEYNGSVEIIPLTDIPGYVAGVTTTIYIGAHGVTGTEYCSVDELPVEVTGEVCWPTGDPSKYFELTIIGDGVLDGDHDAWCADPGLKVGLSLALGNCTGPVDWAVVTDVPSEINCLLNLYNLGLTVGTTGDMQLALWILIEDLADLDALDALYDGKRENMISYYGGTLGEQAANVAAILEMVDEDCDGFDPGCCDVMGILLVPTEPLEVVEDPVGVFTEILRQPIIIAIPAPCCETIWGSGDGDPEDDSDLITLKKNGKDKRQGSWATYITHDLEPEPG